LKPNIIFVLLDGARWDRIHTSPEFCKLKKDGTILDNISTVFPYTAGALNVIFSGKYGKENGVDGYYKVLQLKDDVRILPEILQENGYFTSRGIINDQLLSPRGYDLRTSHNEYEDDLNVLHPELIRKTIAASQTQKKSAFIFLQFTRIHTVTVSEVLKKYEWNSQEFYDSKDNNLQKYDETFREAGIYAQKINETVKELGISDNTIIVFFTDHGTGVGERFGERNYGSFTYDETIRTFYLFIGPNIQKSQTSNKLRSTIDIFPTLLDVCNIEVPSDIEGESFANHLQGNISNLPEKAFTFSETGALHGPFPSPERSNVFCIKTKEHKLIFHESQNVWELFNLSNDPEEKSNLYGTGTTVESNLKEKLLNWINRSV